MRTSKISSPDKWTLLIVMSRFLPNFGKYMLNVLQGISNGEEKDRAWSWKSGQDEFKDEHSFGLLMEKSAPRKELRDLERASCRTSSARL